MLKNFFNVWNKIIDVEFDGLIVVNYRNFFINK